MMNGTEAERQQTSQVPVQKQNGLEIRDFSGLKVIKVSQLKGVDLPPVKFVIDELLTEGLTFFAGPPKYGKSWLALDMCECICQGLPFWGHNTNKGAVLYLALEDNDRRMKSRLEKICSRFPDAFDYSTKGAKPITRGLIEQLEGWMASVTDPRLIVVDTLARVKPSAERGRNAYEDDSKVYGLLQEFAAKHEIAVLGVTHYSKLSRGVSDVYERITGSMGGFGVADEAIVIFGNRGEEQTVKVTGRDILDKEFQAKFDEDSCTWELLGSTEDVAKRREFNAYKRSGIVRAILRLTKQTGKWSGKAVELLEEAREVEQDRSVSSASEVGKIITRFKKLFLDIDGVDYWQDNGGKAGRGYHFQRVKESY